jgi:hypothetical protein
LNMMGNPYGSIHSLVACAVGTSRSTKGIPTKRHIIRPRHIPRLMKIAKVG